MNHTNTRRKAKAECRQQEMVMLERALAHHRLGRLEEAEHIYRTILQSCPRRRDVVHLLGLVSHQLGKAQAAIEMLQLATELDPDHADAHNDLGNILHEAGRLDRAERAYRRAMAIDPRHAKAHNNLGIVLKDKGLLDEAIDTYHRAIQLDPSDGYAYYNLGIALEKSTDMDSAVDALRRAIDLSPGANDARRLLCSVLRQAKRFAELEAAFDQWLERDPANAVAQHLRAAVTGSHVPTRASDEYVRSVFDQFAPHFDEDLKDLGYDVPRLVGAMVGQAFERAQRPLIILDAGCGTGLCGIHLRSFAAHLDGVDLSPKMIEKAAQLGIYDRLEVEELMAFMNNHASTYDLIVAGDTFNYFGDLRPLLVSVGCALNASGHLIFTLELGQDVSDGYGFQLQLHGRYSHAESYVKRSLLDAGFQIAACDTITMRKHEDKDVKGLLLRTSMETRRPKDTLV